VLRPEGRELDDVVSREEVLRQIAAVTGGEFRAGTLGTPAIRAARQVRVGSLRTVAIWSHPLLLFLAVGLLASEWMVRPPGRARVGRKTGVRFGSLCRLWPTGHQDLARTDQFDQAEWAQQRDETVQLLAATGHSQDE